MKAECKNCRIHKKCPQLDKKYCGMVGKWKNIRKRISQIFGVFNPTGNYQGVNFA